MGDLEVKEWINVLGVKVKSPCDMPDDILKFAIDRAKEELKDLDQVSQGEQAIQNIKNAMDETWEPNWHVIVGKNFGSKVTHEARRLVYFYVYDLAVLMYKA